MKVTLSTLACAAGLALSAPPGKPSPRQPESRKPLPESVLDRLRQEQLISPAFDHDEAGETCNHGHSLGFNDLFLKSDAVIQAEISKVEYLYKEGGPFRTEYTLDIVQTHKGGVSGQVKVLSQYGPSVRDHSRWKTGARFLRLARGDRGIFFLDQTALRGLAADRPDKLGNLAGKYMFLGDVQGIYLTQGDEFDAKFMAAAKRPEKGLTLSASHRDMRKMNDILSEKEGNGNAE